jgi:CubicO group peptidase (beta-lactamase class C family)
MGYHAQTFGFLLGEAVRRTTGATLTQWLHRAVTEPLGVEDEVHFGVPEPLLPRVASQVPPEGPALELPTPGSPLSRALARGVLPGAARRQHDRPSTDPVRQPSATHRPEDRPDQDRADDDLLHAGADLEDLGDVQQRR